MEYSAMGAWPIGRRVVYVPLDYRSAKSDNAPCRECTTRAAVVLDDILAFVACVAFSRRPRPAGLWRARAHSRSTHGKQPFGPWRGAGPTPTPKHQCQPAPPNICNSQRPTDRRRLAAAERPNNQQQAHLPDVRHAGGTPGLKPNRPLTSPHSPARSQHPCMPVAHAPYPLHDAHPRQHATGARASRPTSVPISPG
jgi:hypothetical protein